MTFWMYRDNGFNTNTDRIDVLVNTSSSITGALNLGTINRSRQLSPAVATVGWYQYSFVIPNSFSGASNFIFFRASGNYGNDIYLDDVQITSVAAPPTPTQDPTPPTCSAGTTIDIAGTPEAGSVWYWQTSSTGTSTASPYTGAMTVTSNGTYFVRSFNSTLNVWSPASSITISNFPLATPPPAPVALQNPACAPGTTISVAPAPAGMEYYWQGTNSAGVDNSNNASTPYTVTTSGTYYVAAYDPSTQCWSNTTGITVVVDSYVPPAPIVAQDIFNICSGTPSLEISAVEAPLSQVYTYSFGTNIISSGDGILSLPINIPAFGYGAVINSATLNLTNVNAINGSWRSEIRVGLSGIHTLAPTAISAAGSGGLVSPDPVLNLTGFTTSGGVLNLNLSESYNDFGVDDATFGSATLVLNVTYPSMSINWYDMATGGAVVGSGTPFETIGTTVMPTATLGSHEFYAGFVAGGCTSTSRTLVTVNVVDVNAELDSIDVTCNGGNNGSFTLGSVECGMQPFTYSVNGGAFGGIPTDLTAGVYSVVIMDDNGLVSAPIMVVVNEPLAPQNLNAINTNYFSTDLSWTPQGNETQWIVEYGPAGFTPGTGIIQTVSTSTITITGLTEATDYEFYVVAVCGAGSDVAGPSAFSTNQGYFTSDNECGPGFTDISTSGTPQLVADESGFGVTLPFTFNYQGISTSQLTIYDNGALLVGTLTGTADFTNGTMAAAANGLYPFWDDLDAGTIYTQTIGVAPNRQFIAQWHERPHFVAVGGQNVTFQVIIQEADGEIYFLYEDVVFGGSQSINDFGGSATVGVAGPTTDIQLSYNNSSYLQDNSCVHFYYALCPKPTNLAFVAGADEASIDWNAGLYGETDWTIIYGPTGFDPLTSGTTITTGSSDALIIGLDQMTTYDVYIYSECTADNLTSEGLFGTFTTLPFCADPISIGGTSAVDSIFANWNWTESSPTYPIQGFNIQYGMNGFDLYSEGTIVAANGVNFTDTVADAALLSGGVYQIYVQAVCTTGDTSNFAGPITITMPLTNDGTCSPENLPVDGTVNYFNNAGATVQTGESTIAPPNTGAQ
ncbi:MAG: fibronectin type III domain-containing protein, partial [Proteiniphilum sp.]|nr:fibronectin type III domain-containing protein [Proteiniphilum sp.]